MKAEEKLASSRFELPQAPVSAHLRYHVTMSGFPIPEQVAHFNNQRGYIKWP
jgi:hypothetical protein